MNITKKDVARFWSRVNVGDDNSCWYWNNATHSFGYGYININGKNYLSHRIALIIWNDGKVEKDKFVLHSCNNPACCNPNHLRWGTQKENINDCIKAGRKTNPPRNGINPPIHYGTDNNNAIMDEKKVLNLREDWSNKMEAKQLSKKYGIAISTVYQIINFKSWRQVKPKGG